MLPIVNYPDCYTIRSFGRRLIARAELQYLMLAIALPCPSGTIADAIYNKGMSAKTVAMQRHPYYSFANHCRKLGFNM